MEYYVYLDPEGSKKVLLGIASTQEEKDLLYSAVACCMYGGENEIWNVGRYVPNRIWNAESPKFWQPGLPEDRRRAGIDEINAQAKKAWTKPGLVLADKIKSVLPKWLGR